MDGLLLDTERVSLESFKQACHNLDEPYLEDVYLSIIGTNAAGIRERITAGYGPSLDYYRLRKEWVSIYHQIVEHRAIPIKAGVRELLDWLYQHKIPLAVATSTHAELASRKLQLAGLLDYFEHLTTGCEITHSKPHPEIYQLAASRLKVEPSECLAFEDSNNGVRSALAAGMHVIQVPDLVPPTPSIRQLGHLIVNSLHDVLRKFQEDERGD